MSEAIDIHAACDDLLYEAWVVIANAGFTPDQEKSEGWYEAAERWRDKWHTYLERSNRCACSSCRSSFIPTGLSTRRTPDV